MTEERAAVIRDLSTPLASGKGWIKFLGIITIIGAALAILGSLGIGIIWAWLPIWMGVLLLQAGGAIERAQTAGDEASMRLALSKLRTYFVIQGVLIIITFALVLPMFFFWLNQPLTHAVNINIPK